MEPNQTPRETRSRHSAQHIAIPKLFILGVTAWEWCVILFLSALLILGCSLSGIEITLWTSIAVLLVSTVICHLHIVASRYVAIPSLIAFSVCLQWVIAPWISKFFPPTFPLFRMSTSLEYYLEYAAAATAAFWIGLHLPLVRILRKPLQLAPTNTLTPKQRNTMDGIILVGIVLVQLRDHTPSSVAFLFDILSSFRFFAVLCWMLTQTSGWQIRILIVLGHLFFKATEFGIFYQLIHWSGYFLLVYAFIRKWRWRLAMTLALGIFSLSVLQLVKQDYRDFVAERGAVEALERFQKLTSLIHDRVMGSNIPMQEGDVGDILVRFNQGWIISRLLVQVPTQVEYAKGKTLVDAAFYTLIPRSLFPEKKAGASKDLFIRYMGLPLSEWTSMGLSVIGEFYINFGYGGGIATTFIYAFVIGLIFLKFLRLSAKSPFWWALAPLILLPAVEPSWNMEDISNHMFKSAIVVVFLVWKVRSLRELLGLKVAALPGRRHHHHHPSQAPLMPHRSTPPSTNPPLESGSPSNHPPT